MTEYVITCIAIAVTAAALVLMGERISDWIRQRRDGGGQ